jgi:hypothetical protein
MNNPTVYSPYGTQVVEFGGEDNAHPVVTQTLSPEQQALYEQQTAVQQQMGKLAGQSGEALEGVIGVPIDFEGQPPLPTDAGAYRQDVQDAMMARHTVDLARERENTRANLIAGGHNPGGEAFGYAMDVLNRKDTDARQRAILASGGETTRQYALSEAMRRQGIAEYLTQRNQPINELSAMLSGSQVSNPFTMPGFQGGANVQGADLLGAEIARGQYGTDVYNAKMAAAASANAGLMGLGGSAMMGAGIAAAGASMF